MINSTISFQILPKTKSDSKNIEIIDCVIKMVQQSGVSYIVGPMETTMEGNLDTLFEIVRRAQDLCVKEGAESVFTNVKILYRPKGVMTIIKKISKYQKK